MAHNDQTHLIFVYGTLKKGEPNYDQMVDTSKGKAVFMGKGETTAKYPLVVETQYNIPFLLNVPGEGYNVQGEVYEVDDALRDHLDDFESHPDLYKREEASILLYENEQGERVTPTKNLLCSVYFLPVCDANKHFLQKKWLKTYSSICDDHPPYVSRYYRPASIVPLVFPK